MLKQQLRQYEKNEYEITLAQEDLDEIVNEIIERLTDELVNIMQGCKQDDARR